MRKLRAKAQKAKERPAVRQLESTRLAFKKRNYLLLGAGLIAIATGLVFLSMGSTRVAPLLLVVGYCVLVPLALLLK
ncbi:MAG: hypothetical protein ACUVUR_04160 [bacterium]